MHELSKGSANPIVYLLTGYFKNNQPVGKLEPVVNRILVAEEPSSAIYQKKKPVVLKTNPAGIISTLHSETLTTRQPFNAHKDRPIILPPLGAVSLLIAKPRIDKDKSWSEEFITHLNAYQGEVITLKLQTVPIANLKTPQITEQGSTKENNKDETYNKWYAQEITAKKVETIQAFVLARTRAVILSINANIPIADNDWNVRLYPPENDAIDVSFDKDTKLAVISDTSQKLPKGLYRIQIILSTSDYRTQASQWCSKSISFDGTNYYYELAEMVRFDIQNEAGEFDIINCDPISVEEALIKQFPRFYSHLVSYAKDLKTDHATYDPKNINVKDKDGKVIGKAKISDQPIKMASGYENFCHGWAVARGKAQLAAGLIATDITSSVSASGVSYNGKFVLASKIAKALHVHLSGTEDKTVQATLDSVFAMQNGKDAWQALRKARANTSTASFQESLRTSLWDLPTNTTADLTSHNSTLAGRVGIPKKAMDGVGNALNVANLVTDIAAIAQSSVQQWGTNIPNLEQAKQHYKTVATDYFNRLSEKDIVEDVVIEATFALGKDEVSDTYRDEILQHSQAIMAALEKNPELNVTITGHTCDIGNYDDNMDLSARRAEAVKHVLLTEGNIDEARVEALGLGFTQPVNSNNSDENRAENRRVHIAAYAISQLSVCPSREGIDSLERFRNLTVVNDIKVDEAYQAMAWQMANVALGVMAFIPATAPLAAAVALIQAGSTVVTSAANLLDETLLDNICKKFYADMSRDKQLGQECAANQGMMHELLREYKKEGNTEQSTQWAAQFRLRSEAVSGLVGLLLRAQREGDKSDYYDWLARYKVKAYIENFLLADSWALPNLPGASIRMDTYWVYLIDGINAQQKANNKDFKALYGFNENYALIDTAARKAVLSNSENRLYAMSQRSHHGFYMMSMPEQAQQANYITAEFQKYFPIHTLGTQEQSSDKYLESFANTFQPVFSDYGKDSYHHSAIYYQDSTNAWLPIADEPKKRLTPFTPIRVIVVFNDSLTSIAPVTFKLVRCDGVNVGMNYKELIKPLNKAELLSHEQHFAGKFGCVFTPFFQLGPKTYLGTKPLAHSEAFLPFVNDTALEYYDSGNLSNMRYYIGCQVGSSSDVILPLKSVSNNSGANSEIIFDDIFKDIPNDFYVDVDKDRDKDESSLLIKDFLSRCDSTFIHPELFAGNKSTRILIRFGGRGKPYLLTSKVERNRKYIRLFESEFTAAQNLGFNVRQHGDDIIFDDFDWNTEVDIMVIATSSELTPDNYTKELIGLNWRVIPCSLTLQQTQGFDDEGPTYPSKLYYLGKATRNTRGGFRMESVPGGHVEKWQNDDYKFDSSGGIKSGRYKEFINMLEPSNNNDNSNKGRALLGWHDKDAQAFGGDESAHVFAAHFSLSYDTPKKVTVKGLRPFGELFNTEEDREETMGLSISKFSSAGNSGFSFSNIGSMLDTKTNQGLHLELPLPNPTDTDLPWAKKLSEKELEKIAPYYKDKDDKPTETFVRLSTVGLTAKEVKQWFVGDAKKLKMSATSAFKLE